MLGAGAWYLGAYRIYQVDEAQNLFMIRILGTHQTAAYFSNALLWMLGPFAWGAASATTSAGLFFGARMVFLGVFLLNVVLLALNTGARLRSVRGMVALLGAATLAPLWDYGFEVRHDNLILTGLLLMWWLGRARPRGRWSYAVIGFLGVTLLFIAFKSFVFVLPLCLALIAFPPPGHHESRLRLLGFWLLGAGAGAILVLVSYGVSGLWTVYLAGFKSGLQSSGGGARFGPNLALGRLLDQTPLLLGLSVAALMALILRLKPEGRRLLNWEGLVPEAVLCLGALGIVLINPTPFPYNLVNFVPFLYLLAFRFMATWAGEVEWTAPLPTLLACVLVFTHLVPFLRATWRHTDWLNDRQETLMQTAEALTDPGKDRVYDAIGMVPTRPTIGFHWYLHSLNIQTFSSGQIASVPQMLEARPAAVLIRSYRTDWLPEADQQFILSRYIPLADDLWVLGKVLPPGGGNYAAVHPGRYQVLSLEQGRLARVPLAELDGKTLDGNAAFLAVGTHLIASPPKVQPVVVWVGPRLNQPPKIGRGDHLRLFVNWY